MSHISGEANGGQGSAGTGFVPATAEEIATAVRAWKLTAPMAWRTSLAGLTLATQVEERDKRIEQQSALVARLQEDIHNLGTANSALRSQLADAQARAERVVRKVATEQGPPFRRESIAAGTRILFIRDVLTKATTGLLGSVIAELPNGFVDVRIDSMPSFSYATAEPWRDFVICEAVPASRVLKEGEVAVNAELWELTRDCLQICRDIDELAELPQPGSSLHGKYQRLDAIRSKEGV